MISLFYLAHFDRMVRKCQQEEGKRAARNHDGAIRFRLLLPPVLGPSGDDRLTKCVCACCTLCHIAFVIDNNVHLLCAHQHPEHSHDIC